MSQITHFCVTLSVFNYMGSFENEILSKGWKSLDKDASQGLHGKSLGSLQFGFTPLMKPSFITFNCNILSCYGLGKLNLMGRLTKFQVMLASLTFLCCQWQAFYHNVYFLVLDEWVKKIANVFKLSPFNFFCINAFLLCIKIQKKKIVWLFLSVSVVLVFPWGLPHVEVLFFMDFFGCRGFSEWHTKCDSLSPLLALKDWAYCILAQ